VADPFDDKTVLVVDDDPDILSAIGSAFADRGATIETANNGNTAVQLAEQKNPDLVILDIMLPQKSGFLVLERLRQGRKPGQKPYVVMITANEGRRHRQYAEALGVSEYLLKPVSLERLVEVSERLLAD
jgi:CheY-like chemotaxis protein